MAAFLFKANSYLFNNQNQLLTDKLLNALVVIIPVKPVRRNSSEKKINKLKNVVLVTAR